MKNILIISVLLIGITACKKNTKQETSTIDKASLNEIINNYGVYTEGDFTLICNDVQTGENTYKYLCGFGGILFDSTINFVGKKSLRLGKVNISNIELVPIPHFNTAMNQMMYPITTTPDQDNYIAGLFTNKTVPIKIYDTTLNEITSFNFVTPQRLHINPRESIIKTSDFANASITWNADANNKVGLVLEVSYLNSGSFDNKVVFLADDGTEKIKDIIGDYKGSIDIEMYRGTILIKKGTDNKNYKMTCIAKSTIGIYIE